MRNGLITYADGTRRWYKDDQCHREGDLPAIIWNDGSQFWLIHDLQHREQNPSAIYTDGNVRWCLRGIEHSFETWCDLTNKSPKEKAYLALKYL